MRFYKRLLIIVCVLGLSACATPYKPTTSVLNMKKELSKARSAAIVSKLLINKQKSEGICAANGIPGAGFFNNGWDVDDQRQGLKFNNESVSFNAFRKILHHSTGGNVATGTYTSTSTSREKMRRSIKFSDFDTATIFYEMNSLNRLCYFDKGYAEVRVTLKTGTGHWISVLVKNENLEKFIAASMVVSRDIVFKTK